MGSLYERLGGTAAVGVAVERFYEKVMADERIRSFFNQIDMKRQMSKQKRFLTMIFGGPTKYDGLDMREGHAHLVAQGLNDSHVDAVIELLGQTLQELGVGTEDIAEVARIAESVRDDVLNRDPIQA